MTDRSKAPVFVLGCHRSGTNLLYDTLMSAGGFARYADELCVYQTLIPRFGDLRFQSHRRKLMDVWLRSKAFRRSGLDTEEIRAEIVEKCASGGDFYQIVMGGIVRKQSAQRWAAYGPDNAFYIPQIQREIPAALFIHIIRDGRDVALGLSKKPWIPSLPWDTSRRFLIMGAFWKWMVLKGQQNGRLAGSNYIEVQFENLVLNPRETLARLSDFLSQELDYDRIQHSAVGTVVRPNSSHYSESTAGDFNPAGRWRKQISAQDLSDFEALYGDLLQNLGYKRASNEIGSPRLSNRVVRTLYPFFFESKLQLKSRTPLRRLASLTPLEIQ